VHRFIENENMIMSRDEQFTTVLKTVASYYRVSSEDILKRTRRQPIAKIRQVVAVLCRKHTTMTYKKIGAFLGLDHSTIINAWRRWDKGHLVIEGLLLGKIEYKMRGEVKSYSCRECKYEWIIF